MRARSMLVVIVSAMAVALVGTISPANATGTGNQGCTPGYWKNHTDAWQEAAPTDLMSSIYQKSAGTSVGDVTLVDALGLPGGAGVEGAERILARASVAAYLNAAHDGVGYPWRRGAVGLAGRPPLRRTVNQAYASGDRDVMLDLASRLDADNNLGCPLS